MYVFTHLASIPYTKTYKYIQIRIFRAMIYHIYFQPSPIPQQALFQPVITSTRTPLLETDYNLHKSNSTYFSDMDISRTHFFTALIRNGIRKNRKGHIVALGGISCLFKKEILPYTKFEMWTRLLCWDRKWFYLITHMVKPGVGKPTSWTLQPWKKTKKPAKDVSEEELLKGVYATAIAKYVIKKGRLTIAPEQVLLDADMVPVKPEGWVYQGETVVANGDANGHANGNANGHANGVLPKPVEGKEWNWDIIEAERLRGLALAQKFADMDGMHGFFNGGKDGALGEYPDLLF
jgi:acyl-CoA thioesterase FadM